MHQLYLKKRLLNSDLNILLDGCKRNDTQSQAQLYRICYPAMINICYRYAPDADGAGTIFNNAMLRVFKHIGTYIDEGRLMAWIKTIVINCSIDFCKKRNLFRQSVPYFNEEDSLIDPQVFERVSAKEIQHMIRKLPESTAIVFNMFIYEGFTHKQIGTALGISENTSKWHVSEGKRLLRTQLEHFFTTEMKTNAAG